MKAIVIHEYGGPDVLKYEDYPDPSREFFASGKRRLRMQAVDF
jgi:NADPH:quinone reductase-like Zn-dependent oxidoreductase